MASKPGLLTDWPWRQLGSFKYVLIAPWMVHSVYSFVVKEKSERDITNILIFPFMLWRMFHNQIWISISRYRTAKGNNRIVDKSIEFDQVDRERDWDDLILFNTSLFYIFNATMARASQLPIWRTDGVTMTILLHAGPVEFLYYWLHRALHQHYLYSRYHSHHHSSIVTEPISSVVHPFAEHLSYFFLFAIPVFSTILTQTASLVSLYGYVIFIDFMNNMGHCNFEMVPKKLFSIFPPLKYIMYTPTYHSLHHTKFRTNYSLFMPIYDYMYGTMDDSTDALHETSLKRQEDSPDVVHLTHLTTPDSVYHLRLGFAFVASKPHMAKWYLWLMWPVTWCTMILTCIFGRAFVAERNIFKNLKLQSWAIPRYTRQYKLQCQRETINSFIEEAILRAEERGTKVLSLGLLNQGEELNGNGELYVRRHPQLSVKVVNGSSLAAAIVLNSIPKGTTQILFRGKQTKLAHSIIFALCEKGIKVATLHEDEYKKLKLATNSENNLQLTKSCAPKVWLVGDGLTEEEQRKADNGTLFIPFTPIPPKQIRSDCFYLYTPAMLAPSSLENLDSCENCLPRRVMSVSRIAGIVHALEGWNVHECEATMFNIDKVWEASLKHGFRPLTSSNQLIMQYS